MSQILRVENISKRYPGVLAVDDISFSLEKGEVLALLGENGAGKSTLMKMICGAIKPDAGKIFIEDEEMSFESSHDAMKAGIGMVYQDLSMVGSMSVAENIFMNRQPVKKFGGILWNKLYADTQELLRNFNLNIDPKTPVKRLSAGNQQLLEILKALSSYPKVIILDEPTSSLAESEIKLLFDNIRKLINQGYSFIYITHKLSEVFKIADRVMVMRDGKYISSKKISEVDERTIITMMVGREIKELYGAEHKNRKISDEFFFKVEGLSAKGMYQNITFGIRKGEIIGFAGLIGAGRTEMALGIFGAHKRDKGIVILNGKQINIRSPQDAIKNKIAYLTEDRKKYGLYLNYPVKSNLIASNLKKFSTRGFMKKNKIDENALKEIKKYSIATPSINQKMSNLSGGNQQKCLISIWLGIDPEILIMDELTRGVDVGTKAEIYENIKKLSDEGKGIMIISSELPELIGICDRIFVMHEGKLRGMLHKNEFSEDLIMEYATGICSNI